LRHNWQHPAGRPELYDYVKEADKKGVAPGSEALKNLFDDCGPCLILMDELVAYAKKLYGVEGLPAGSFDNFITFIQEITEAAKASRNSLVVASIPESEHEIGGDAGEQAAAAIEHTFGRVEAIWKPVAANEGFEIVRRRLFLDCKDPDARDRVCTSFSRMYAQNSSDFPSEAKEVEYRERMISCYPIHPEIFDRLYEDWATLEDFQRTRGVLRLMAAVIHELWMGNDSSAMIMPGSIPLDAPAVRDELIRYLPDGWNSIVSSEIDGKNSIPYMQDQKVPRYGQKLASRRIARTIMLGSAPTVRAQSVRGIEASRIRLGVVQPGESIADFNDALNNLQGALAYLYSNASDDRYWYDTRPTLRKTVKDRATQIPQTDVDYEIERRMHLLHKEHPFAGLHIFPGSSLDVTDDQAVRLVILRTDESFRAATQSNDAIAAAEDILNNRGQSPRIFRNMLAFIAPDQELLQALKIGVRDYLAWSSVKDDSEVLNLDAAQNHETDNNLRRSSETVDARIKETYCWLLVPYIDRKVDMKTITWDTIRISGGQDSIVQKAAQKMIQNESLITKWAPALLQMQLDDVLWKDTDNLQISKLWEYLCTYCYLPRLANYDVLEETIRNGAGSSEYFAVAGGYSNNRYIDLKFNQQSVSLNRSDYLVKKDIALKQLNTQIPSDTPDISRPEGGANTPADKTTETTDTPSRDKVTENPPLQPKNTRFYMTAVLDNTRINRDVSKLVEEVISNLTCVDGSDVEVTLEVHASAPKGFSQETIRIVSENCSTLKVKGSGFDK
jgi:predicted AAA+ superfamily ATPase